MSLHGNNLHALAAMDSGSSEPPQHFRFCDIFKIRVLHPFLVILVLMFILQFCGQGVITFYTVQIFKVRMWIGMEFLPGRLQYYRVSSIHYYPRCLHYYPLLPRTLAVLSRQRTALLSLESLTSSQLCSGVYTITMATIMLSLKAIRAKIQDLSPSPALY